MGSRAPDQPPLLCFCAFYLVRASAHLPHTILQGITDIVVHATTTLSVKRSSSSMELPRICHHLTTALQPQRQPGTHLPTVVAHGDGRSSAKDAVNADVVHALTRPSATSSRPPTTPTSTIAPQLLTHGS
jgi:hypothetical protein